jgi:hypothetical protein
METYEYGVPPIYADSEVLARLLAEAPVVKLHYGSGVEAMLPSIMPDEFVHNHAVELDICLRRLSSDAGQVAKIDAPAGYANVRVDALFHRDYLQKQRNPQQGSAQLQLLTLEPRRWLCYSERSMALD